MRIFTTILALLISVQILLAVPAGRYYDDRGKFKVLVDQSGTIYCLDSNQNVTSTWSVVKEEPNGRFYIKLVHNGQVVGDANGQNSWWSEKGVIYLNLANQLRTLHLK